jgi:hypothetical protein
MSRLQVFTIESFHALNPDWKICVYIPKQRYRGEAKYIPDYTGKDYFSVIENMYFVEIIKIDLQNYFIDLNLHNILRSDIFRYYILYDVGGVWSDFDVIWLKPMEHINNIEIFGNVSIGNMGTMVILYETIKGHHNISIMLSCEKHQFYKTLINESISIQENQNKGQIHDHQTFGSEMLGVMYPTLNDVIDKFGDIVGFKYETFFPYSIFNMEQLYNQEDLTPLESNNVMCVHWFNGHSLSKEYVNQNKFGNDSSMTRILQNCGY